MAGVYNIHACTGVLVIPAVLRFHDAGLTVFSSCFSPGGKHPLRDQVILRLSPDWPTDANCRGEMSPSCRSEKSNISMSKKYLCQMGAGERP